VQEDFCKISAKVVEMRENIIEIVPICEQLICARRPRGEVRATVEKADRPFNTLGKIQPPAYFPS